MTQRKNTRTWRVMGQPMSEESRYILAKKINRGGMAEIYLGKQIGQDGFERVCAIKRILPHYAQDQEFIQMFRDEAHICKRLQHANIVRVEGFEEVEGSYAIIMEYVSGADLRSVLHAVEQSGKRMPVPMACYIVAEAARGLHYAHTKMDEITQQALGIVHRDISPQNILLSFEGEVKVTDFGIADAESKMTETRPGIVKGKYSYMSPEQIAAKDVDARTDIFALSIVLWEMLAMKRLFQGENEVDTIQRVKNCRIEDDLRRLNSDVDEELDAIIRKGLAKDPKKRFKTAADFEKELRRYMSRRFPEFTPVDLGEFLRAHMESRALESAQDIRKTLTETKQKPKRPTGKRRSVDLAIEAGDASQPQPVLSVVKPLAAGTMSKQGPAPSALTRNKSFNRTNFTRNTNLNPVPYSRRSQAPTKVWVLGAIASLLLLLGGFSYMKFQAHSRPSQIVLETSPPRVKIMVDGKTVNRGHYVRASRQNRVVLTLKPGRHIMTVMRDGYRPYKYEFNLDQGEQIVKDDIVLKESGTRANMVLKLTGSDRPVRIDINKGFWLDTLAPGRTRDKGPDLMMGKSYRLRVIVEGEKDFSCSIKPKTTALGARQELVIDRKARRCQLN